ncbi:MAG: tRNA uridine-5-carboxymethylaminomethyl(34) synthesis enzyme MnmG [Acetanaerobacterium sp.]
MSEYSAGNVDIAVIGAGHAGCEAALAAARLGASVVLFTLSLDAIANMPCNPSIGGTAKGHLVREIDALGGEMGRLADKTTIQSRMLNRGKGPAVYSLRAQIDRMRYHIEMKHLLECTPGLVVRQAEVCEVRADENGQVCAVVTRMGAVFGVGAAIVSTGTYLGGRIFVGECTYESGPDGCQAATHLTASLNALGIATRRFKTGTPGRLLKSSIDLSRLEVQYGDEPVEPFSFETDAPPENRAVCHIAYTNTRTHDIIKANLHRSPLYGGMIEGIGPRYCPSIEDKVVRFADKERHQIFLEPMGMDTEEMYLQGMSSSLPEEVQVAMYRTVDGFEDMQMMRTAYAIEYDCCDPLDLLPSLAFGQVKGLYGAGQFCGTSGYEEAAAQGLIAGINAARAVQGKEPLILDRASSYIGTLIDDLTTKGCLDPYRMMTSRSEFRLLLRQDNADKRLTPTGYELGLISRARYDAFCEKYRQVEGELSRLTKTVIPPSDALNGLLLSCLTAPLVTGARLAELIRRPQVSYAALAPFDPERPALARLVCEQAEIEIKYEGYIKRQLAQVEQMRRLEKRPLSPDTPYREIDSLRLEAREKLSRIKPLSIGQASRISGVSPADISVLLVWMEREKGQGKPKA